MIREIDPTSINPFGLKMKYSGSEEIFKRLIDVATKENLYIELVNDAGVLFRPLLSKILQKDLSIRYVSIKQLESFNHSLEPTEIIQLAKWLKGEEEISFRKNIDLIYFEREIAAALNRFINKESKIYNDLVKLKKVSSS